jgi:8-oxo-dGTP diphosphatase
VSEPLSPLWVAALAMVDQSGRVLMQQRLAGGAHGGLWEFPGGKLEEGEAPEQAAVRELAEELGVVIEAADLSPIGFASGRTGAGADRSLVILLYACHRWTGAPSPHAAAQLAWYDLADLEGLAMPPLDYPLAAALRAMLG